MKTYWVVGKTDLDTGKDDLNPLQKDSELRYRYTKTFPNEMARRRSSSRSPYNYNLGSMSVEPAYHILQRRSPPAPDEWPKLDVAIRSSSSPPQPLATCMNGAPWLLSSAAAVDDTTNYDIDLNHAQSVIDQSQQLQTVTAASQLGRLSLDDYARIAETNAQNARILADWVAELATVKGTAQSADNATADHQEERQFYCVIL